LIFTWALGSTYVVTAIFIASIASDQSIHGVSGVGLPARLPGDFWRFGHTGFIVSLIAIGLAFILAHWTNLHQRAAAIGASSLSAEYAGVPRKRTYLECFLFNAWFAALAGMHHSLYLTQATTRDLFGTELTPIAIALLGGTSLAGGYLRLSSVLAAAFFWATVRLLGPHLTSVFQPLSSIQAELGQILFYAIFIVVSLLFGRLLAPRIPKVFARQEE
jgi:ribose/xylose/arabinose/galactoside ABC-type transport system permease subunit